MFSWLCPWAALKLWGRDNEQYLGKTVRLVCSALNGSSLSSDLWSDYTAYTVRPMVYLWAGVNPFK